VGAILAFEEKFGEAFKYFNLSLKSIESHKYIHKVKPFILLNIGDGYLAKKQHDLAVQFFKESLEILLKFFGENSFFVGWAYSYLGNAYFSMGNYKKSLDFYEKAKTIREKFTDENDFGLGNCNINLGKAYQAMGESQKSLELFALSLKAMEKYPMRLAQSYYYMGSAYYDLKD